MGYCGIYLAADEGEITNVAVAPEYRRQGIAEKLVKRLMEETRSLGIRTYILEVRVSNQSAINVSIANLVLRTAASERGFMRIPRRTRL